MVEVELKIEDSKINIIERFHSITGNIHENIDNVGGDVTSLNFGGGGSEVALRYFFVCDLLPNSSSSSPMVLCPVKRPAEVRFTVTIFALRMAENSRDWEWLAPIPP